MSKSFNDLKESIASGSLDKVRALIAKSKRKEELKSLSEDQIKELERLLNNTTIINGDLGQTYKEIRELVTEYIKEMRENNHQNIIIATLINASSPSGTGLLFKFDDMSGDEWVHVGEDPAATEVEAAATEVEAAAAEETTANSWIPIVLKRPLGL